MSHRTDRMKAPAVLVASAVTFGVVTAALQSWQAKGQAAPGRLAAAAPVPASKIALASAGETNPYIETIPGTKVSFHMVSIPGGTFTMGSPQDEQGRSEDEGPQHQVQINPF